MQIAETLRDEDVQRVLRQQADPGSRCRRGCAARRRALQAIIAGGHHSGVFNEILARADRYLAGHYEELCELFEAEAPRWVPDTVYQRVFDRMYTRLRHRLLAMAADLTTRRGSSSRNGSPGSPAASKPPRSCVSAASA